ncbi:glycine-rich RNA-binding protein 4, mitochondrial-like [Salvia splendens]|uniref:glycine-rich RNA-binding protein 4, mitochondrial-like n=1 Tax=Salvia splendens TaxID=180675 RepID=UPI001C274896|nr:glycine-rich RNA-binding protein 4, mitochondrial-like [Salvia splendens]
MHMACFNKVGTMLRQSISASSALSGQSSMLNAMRLMSTKLFIGGLSYQTDDQSLRDAFSSFGEVDSVRIIVDRDTGRSRGFGFVNFTCEEAANSAISAMDGQELNGRNIRVSQATEKPPRSNYGGGGGDYGGNSFGRGGGGGYGGGYGNRDESY